MQRPHLKSTVTIYTTDSGKWLTRIPRQKVQQYRPKVVLIVHKSTLLQTPAHPEQLNAFTLRSLILGNIAGMPKCSQLTSLEYCFWYNAQQQAKMQNQKSNFSSPPLSQKSIILPCGGVKLCTQDATHCCIVNPCFRTSL